MKKAIEFVLDSGEAWEYNHSAHVVPLDKVLEYMGKFAEHVLEEVAKNSVTTIKKSAFDNITLNGARIKPKELIEMMKSKGYLTFDYPSIADIKQQIDITNELI